MTAHTTEIPVTTEQDPVTESLVALQAAFSATQLPATEPLGSRQHARALSAVAKAQGYLQQLKRVTDFTDDHVTSLRTAATALHAAASSLELLATGVADHVESGVSFWTGPEGQEAPTLL